MLRLFPLRRSFSLDLAPDDSNSNFLLHANDDSNLIGHSTIADAHLFSSPHLPVSCKSSHSNATVISSNMSTAVHWPVDDIDDALAADFDGSLSGLGMELGTASFNMSEALMALPNLSLKNQDSNGHHHSSNLLLTSSLQTNLSIVRHNEPSTSLERNGESSHIICASSANNVDEKPIAVVHGKKNRLAYGNEDEVANTSIKRFCFNNDRELSNVHILIPNNAMQNSCADEHQCNDDCLNDVHCHLRHSSSVPDLRSNFTNNSLNSNPPVLHSAASSPSSASTPSTSLFSQILSSQLHSNNLSLSINSNHLNHEFSQQRNKSESSKFQYVLGASTSMAIKMQEETMTYLNQAQSYEIKLKKVGDLSEMKGKMLTTILKVCFHDRRLQYMERDLIDQWKEQRPSERILEIDVPLSYGIHDIHNDQKLINRSEFNWDPTKETGVFIRINCISTEFTPKKHGGEKGVPFRIVIETYSNDSLDPSQCLHAASCQVKVFKPKGADRKHKTDREKMNKKPMSEQEKFQPSYHCTVFTDCSMDTFTLYSLSTPGSGNTALIPVIESIAAKLDKPPPVAVKSQPKPAPFSPVALEKNQANYKSHLFNNVFGELNDNSFDLNFSNFSMSCIKPSHLSSTATFDETQRWLKENRFDAYMDTFANFAGSDILLLSKDDMIQICGLTDGIRLFNSLHSKTIKSKLTIYICSTTDEIFRAIYLESLSVTELQSKIISNLLKSKCTYLKRLCIVGPSGIKILMTDDVVRNLPDESLYTVEFNKDYNGEFHAVMKAYLDNTAK